ncbi:hypothetical protein PHAVU_006G091000 [Phaseolus vulgaris]|uniref:SANT domain-containing protein n=1 Tax=Phaseolus vulgaris TaxID=3885 RepID=V7BPS5_PHAVU|nr:hypothetical protein PHAVU_006G091000g [Phaseolus vulgaris]ESW19033.1 hypothetical protein PHAVU_006G091000g [Phaseolus vulgaris]
MTGDSNSAELSESKKLALAPGILSNSWSDFDAEVFLLGLYIFGKNFIQMKSFLENKGMGEILAFYYGKFHKSDAYRRWSDCRKIKGRKSTIGHKLFTGRRQQELLSRLIPHVSGESKDTLLQASKSYTEGRASLEEYISSLKSTVGLGILVGAFGIGKEKDDLTTLVLEPGKNNKVFSLPTCKAWSSLGPNDIMKFLTGFRLSKAKSHDLFWEAVWPRLLGRGWHSEQPKNRGYVSSKDYLVFLIPGVKTFSRRKLVKGDHYFDSVGDVLRKVVAEPNLLDVEEAKVDSFDDEEPERGSDKDDHSDYHRQCYLKPRSSTYNTDQIKFTVIDTSLVHGGKPSDLREFKPVPVNSVGEVEVNVADTHEEAKHMSKVNHNKDISENIDQKLTDTSALCEGKLLKVRELQYLPIEEEDAFKMLGILRESKGRSYDDSPSVIEASMLVYDKKNIGNTDNQNNAKKMVESLENQKTSVSKDNQLKRTIKHQFSRTARSGNSNHAVVPVKKRRLAACSKAKKSHIIKNSSGGLGSEKIAFSRTKVDDPFSTKQKNGSLIPSSDEKSLEENNKESILNEICEHRCVSGDKVENGESQSPVTFNIPQAQLKSEIGVVMAMVEEDEQSLKANDPCLSSDTQAVIEEPLGASSDVGSVVEQQPSITSRRQSTRNRPLSLRALESLANDFLHGERRQKRKLVPTQTDAFTICRKARTRTKIMPNSQSSDNGTAILVEENQLNGNSTA